MHQNSQICPSIVPQCLLALDATGVSHRGARSCPLKICRKAHPMFDSVKCGVFSLFTSVFAYMCGLRGCKNRAHSVSWAEVVKAIPNQGVDCFVSWGSFFLYLFCVSGVCSIVFYCFWLSVPVQLITWKDSSPNDLLCVEWDVKPYTLTHSHIYYLIQAQSKS